MSQQASIILAIILLLFDPYLLQPLILEHLLYQCRPLWLFEARASLCFQFSSFEAIVSTLSEILLMSGDERIGAFLLFVFAFLTIYLQGRVFVIRSESHSQHTVPDRAVLLRTIHAQILLILTHA